MLKLQKKDYNKRAVFQKKELKKKRFKVLYTFLSNFYIYQINYLKANIELKSDADRFFFFKKVYKKLRRLFKFFILNSNTKSSKTKIVRRCIYTNRGRGSLQKFLISRSLLRDLILNGNIPGYKKAIW